MTSRERTEEVTAKRLRKEPCVACGCKISSLMHPGTGGGKSAICDGRRWWCVSCARDVLAGVHLPTYQRDGENESDTTESTDGYLCEP